MGAKRRSSTSLSFGKKSLRLLSPDVSRRQDPCRHRRTKGDKNGPARPNATMTRSPSRRRMAAFCVRRDKAALSSGCKSQPANAPAGSNRSSHGGDEMAEAFGVAGHV